MLLISRQGKVRLSKWYSNYDKKQQTQIIREGKSHSKARDRLAMLLRLHFDAHIRFLLLYFCSLW